ncbi:hypothetical protein Drorol1_Dr00000337 [Drosera rotundifolia]
MEGKGVTMGGEGGGGGGEELAGRGKQKGEGRGGKEEDGESQATSPDLFHPNLQPPESNNAPKSPFPLLLPPNVASNAAAAASSRRLLSLPLHLLLPSPALLLKSAHEELPL